ncbi:E3 ubiquitin-protein ligase TRIM39-like [Xyrichtys novacula]|uniref:E3 ubiquitin-protein ligase TRIM39-like n=1 Tax=Xyrichtys novacula TaxID=13765 RepID=A0AAV1F288_XYRNO|nr:E3 ubiquitin-protein ligase TRIM39-like [Xyrichtys novacula]
MASARIFTLEEQLQCSICLQEFTDPVTTPCGHNYCKACITVYWASTDLTQCPLCMKRFRTQPQLQVNTEFRDMLDHFNNVRLRSEDNILAKPGDVPCDICPGPKFKAQKTCLLCLSSYCQTHLELHQGVTSHKKHQLIEPLSNLENRVCKKHDKMFELFCLVDQTCVCVMCLKDDHVTHKTIPLELKIKERRAQLLNDVTEIETEENTKSRSVTEIKNSMDQRKKQAEKELESIDEVFTDLILSLQRSQIELTDLIKERQEAAEKPAKDHLTKLEREVAELRRRRSEIEALLQADDGIQLLQRCPSLEFPAHGDPVDPLSHFDQLQPPELPDISSQSYLGMVRKSVAQIEKTFSNEMETLIHEVRFSEGCEAAKPVTDEFIEEVWTPPQDRLKMIQQCNAVDVTLSKLHSRSTVSRDGKQVYHSGVWQLLSALFRGKPDYELVLGENGFTSGRFYFEVQVSGCDSWSLGVAKEPNKEKQIKESWTLRGLNTQSHYNKHYCTDDCPLNLEQTPNKVGVFVDYDKGEVSFYNVDTRTLIYSYLGCNFFETQPKSFLYSMFGASFSSRAKLFPLLGIIEEQTGDVLEITPVDTNLTQG